MLIKRRVKIWTKMAWSLTEKIRDGRLLPPRPYDFASETRLLLQEAPRRQEKSSALGAILNTTCSKCGGHLCWLCIDRFCVVTCLRTGHGHLPTECFGAGKKYDLLPEDDGCECFNPKKSP
jgi:hypothetical protein